MDQQRSIIRMGAFVIVLATVLRLSGGGFFQPLGKLLKDSTVQSFLIYLQTGRLVRPSPQTPAPSQTLQTQPPEPTQSQPAQALHFSADELQSISVSYRCDYRPELAPLLVQPLSWSLRSDEPTVLILHTHATEGYTQTPDSQYEEDAAYRTLDERYNMIAIGQELKRVLEAGGISVLHDRTLHDYPSYNGSYDNARATIQEYLRQYPSIQMVLDLHRDASDGANGSQLTTSGTVGGQPSSQLLMVVGTDASGSSHPNWRQNLSLALKLSALLEREDPGLTRPVSLRSSRFNMDLTPGSLLVEVGAAGDTQQQALLAANALGRAILSIAQGNI